MNLSCLDIRIETKMEEGRRRFQMTTQRWCAGGGISYLVENIHYVDDCTTRA